jgi:hypothetical protein
MAEHDGMSAPEQHERPDLVEAWRSINGRDSPCWVLYRHGTCVLVREPQAQLAAHANDLLREWGPVQVGTPAGDFDVIRLENGMGFVVTCHHRDGRTFVGTDEVSPEAAEVMIGLLGRSKRARDAEELSILHVEDGRGRPAPPG